MGRRRSTIRVLPGAMRELRHRAGLTQEQLADTVGVSSGMIALIETGRRQPGADLLERLAAALAVETTTLAFVDDPAECG